MPTTVYSFTVKSIDGRDVSLAEFAGKVLLIVNVASNCGFTFHYEGLEALYKKYQKDGLEILGFPCNQFGGQEPGSESEIASFCQLNYGVSFPLFAKVEVNGPHADPLFDFLKTEKRGLLGTSRIKWNFTKFLVDRNGSPVSRYGPRVLPKDLEADLKKLIFSQREVST